MKEPPRFLHGDQASPLLRDALRALEQRGPSPAALERMRSALPVCAPSSDGAGSVTGHAASGGATLSHAILLGLAVSGALTLHGVSPQLRSSQPAALVEPSPAAASAPEIEAPTPATRSEERTAPPAPRRVRKRAAVEREQPPPAAREYPASAQFAPSPPSAPEPALESAPPSAASESAPEPAAPRAKLDPQDEASLLYRAKRLAGTDPYRALQLLAAHADSFPKGALTEEREVLTIQLHRKLGHTNAAQRLAAEFRARHPHSLYLRSVAP